MYRIHQIKQVLASHNSHDKTIYAINVYQVQHPVFDGAFMVMAFVSFNTDLVFWTTSSFSLAM